MIYYIKSDELYHHGILGQKWGVRRYQNEDGSLTDDGKKRYAKYDKQIKRIQSEHVKFMSNSKKALKKAMDRRNEKLNKLRDKRSEYDDYSRKAEKMDAKIARKEAKYAYRNENGKDYIKQMSNGYKTYEKIIKDFGSLKLKSLDDKSIKNTIQYKKARDSYIGLKARDAYNFSVLGLMGSNKRLYTVMDYARK